MIADPDRTLDAAKALARNRGFDIRDETRARTGSAYFTAQMEGPDGPLSLRVRISGHKGAGWQVRARYVFVTWACPRRARRDLERLDRRLAALSARAADLNKG